MRLIFAGTPANAAATLQGLSDRGHDLVGVLTREDAPVGRKKILTESPVAIKAKELGVEVFKANSLTLPVLEWLTKLAPDLGVIVAYGVILRSAALEVPKFGWINVHYSLLPKYPGPSPVQAAILNGDSSSGVTIFSLDTGIDSGPILAREAERIPEESTSVALLDRLTVIGENLLGHTLENFSSLFESREPQLNLEGRVLTRKITREMAKIDFRNQADVILNTVRAMNPEPMAWFELDSNAVRVLECSVVSANALGVGRAQLVSGELVVGCGGDSLVLKIVQPAGKNPMSGADWFRGLRLESLMLS